jgi:hypothetical protein
MLIFVVNLALIGALFVAASPTVGWADVWGDAKHIVQTVGHWVMATVSFLKRTV